MQKEENNSNNESSSQAWKQFKELFFNQDLFKKGLLIVQTEDMKKIISTYDDRFYLNDREFTFGAPQEQHKSLRQSKKKIQKLLLKIDPTANVEVAIHNTKRRDEVFFPLLIENHEEAIGRYVYPWTDKPEFKFSGFDTFVTCVCLFGANLKAIDQDKKIFSLINHTPLNPNQSIISITFDENVANPYEETFFHDFKIHAQLINKLSKKNPATLVFHLPYFDYILFGVKLYINAKLPHIELERFIQLVSLKAKDYEGKIKKICRDYEINVTIQSPFDNLFSFSLNEITPKKIFESLDNLSTNELTFKAMSDKQKKEFENDMVQFCIQQLKTNSTNEQQYLAWSYFFQMDKNEKINDFDSLFKLANANVLAAAASSKKDNEVCSLLPLTEKQIQVYYSSLVKKNFDIEDEKNKYPAIFNLTILDSVICNDGCLFYFDNHQNTMMELIVSQKTLERASSNLGFFAKKSTTQQYETDFLKSELPKKNRLI